MTMFELVSVRETEKTLPVFTTIQLQLFRPKSELQCLGLS